MTTTDLVAWWGAIVATGLLVWDVVKYLRPGARVRIRLIENTSYPDGRVVSEREIEGGKETELAEYCHVELSNIGSQPTTILGVEASHDAGRKDMVMSFGWQRFVPHFGATIPHVLEPGRVWSARVEMEDLNRLSERGKPFLTFHLSHRKAPQRAWPQVAANKRLDRTQRPLGAAPDQP